MHCAPGWFSALLCGERGAETVSYNHHAGDVKSYWPGAPDLAIEVVSPHDRYTEVNAKVAEWLTHGS